MKRTRPVLGVMLALLMLLGCMPAVSAEGQRDAALDNALNYDSAGYTYTTYIAPGGDIEIVTEGDRTYAVLTADELYQDDTVTWVQTHVAARAGDYFVFDHASSLNYMAGATVSFGYMNGNTFVELYSNYDEGGDGVYDGETVDEWETFQYEIPADGAYDFRWRIDACSTDSRFAVDDVFLYPEMTIERAVNDSEGVHFRWTNDENAPWTPEYYNGRLCAKSGTISHNGSTSLVTTSAMLRAGDDLSVDIATDSESNYDKLNVYYTRTSDAQPAETLISSYSGVNSGWTKHLSWEAPSDGTYSFRFEYKKDTSVSSGGDCVYISSVYADKLSLKQAAAPGFEDDFYFVTYYDGTHYGFQPVFYDGSIGVESNNKGVASSTAYLLFSVDLNVGDTLAFEYDLDSEDNYDTLEMRDFDDDEVCYILQESDTQGFATFTMFADESREYSFILTYHKDSSVNEGRDSAILKNFRIIPDDLSAALRREDSGLDYYRGTGGELIELIDDGERYYASVTVDNAYAVASHFCYHNAYEYVIFDYKVIGEGSKLSFHAYDGVEHDFEPDGNADWQTYYYRIPSSGDIHFDWVFTTETGGTVCLDNIYVGRISIPIPEAANHPESDKPFTDYVTNNFGGFYDPYEPRGVTEYIFADPVAGEMASFEWTVEAEAGDSYEVVFKFFDEDGTPNGSSFRLYLDGNLEADYSDTDLGPNFTSWWRFILPFYNSGEHTFRFEFYSEGNMGGDGFAVSRIKHIVLGVTLDEALNVEGGDIHFCEPDYGTFIPMYDDETDRWVGHPVWIKNEDEEVHYECGFEGENNPAGWDRIDADGNGFTFGVCDPSTYTGLTAAEGDGAFASGPLFEGTGFTGDGVDNWAVSPTFTVPVGGITGSWFTFFAAAASAAHPETLEVYILPNGGMTGAELVATLELDGSYWDNMGISLYKYDGQDVAIGFRHCTGENAYGLFLDGFSIDCFAPLHAELTFTHEFSVGDAIYFELRITPSTTDDLEGNIIISIFEDGENVMNYDTLNLYSQNGADWGELFVRNVSTPGEHTYRIVFSTADESILNYNLLVDEFRIDHTIPVTIIHDIEIEYDIPEAGTTPAENQPTVDGSNGYYISHAEWYDEETESVLDSDDTFEAGRTYRLVVRFATYANYLFDGNVTVTAPGDPGPEVWEQDEYFVVASMTPVTIPAAGLTGDVNNDGEVTMADVSALIAYLMNSGSLTAEGFANADANGDGVVDILDATAIYAIAFGA